MKKTGFIALGIVLIALISILTFWDRSLPDVYTNDENVSMISRIDEKDYQVYSDGNFENKFIKGVNMGATVPGTFPGELAISKEKYLRWFEQIDAMNADVIRVYTTMMPHFYEALHEYNESVDEPLYLMQGVWVNENDIRELEDAFGDDRRLFNDFLNDAKDLVDIIHGNKTLENRPGFAHGTYMYDVSEYVIGWILGIEWSPDFVLGTDESNTDLGPYKGTYMETSKEASPFEIFLSEIGDKVVEYEVDNYSFMRPMSFVNWPTTDHLNHPNEPDRKEDLVSLNMNNIVKTEAFDAGFFASYHIYPYYPEFMNYSTEYNEHIDHRGEVNPYQGYLEDLITNLDMPVIVAEFGVPSARGMTHESPINEFDQGFVSETEQGTMDVHMLEDIHVSGYSGALVFNWQDEWFKRTWNTMDFDLPHRRPFWSNIQTNEQHFGLLAFDPGNETRSHYIDGSLEDWDNFDPVVSNEELDLYTAADERYLYIHVRTNEISLENNRILIPIKTRDNQGNTHIKDTSISFSQSAEFLVDIKGFESGEIFVDAYYDSFYYMYHETLGMLETKPEYREKNTGIFNSIYQALSSELHLPEEDRTIPFSKHNTGVLLHGNANPKDESYNSLNDYYVKDNTLELKIPWLLLNVSDPSTKMQLADFYENNGIVSESVDTFEIGATVVEDPDMSTLIEMTSFAWEGWEEPTYHERLKPSYYILKDAFEDYD